MDPLYDYISEIANRMYPTWEFDDSCGEYFQTDSFRGWDFVHQLEDGRLKSPFTKEQYLENAPIIRSLRAMGIDTEKFWMAMLFVYDVVREQTENVQQVPASVFEEFRIVRIAEEINDARNQQHSVIGNLIGIRTAAIFLFELFQKRQKTFDGKRNLVTTFEIHRKSVQSERTGI